MKLAAQLFVALLGAALLFPPQVRAQGAAEKKDTTAIVLDDILKQMNTMREAFETIKDAETAKTAQKKLDEAMKELNKVVDRAEKLKDKELPKADQEKYKKKFQDFAAKFSGAVQQAAQVPEGLKVLMDFGVKMQKVGTRLQKAVQIPK